eukprot:TRINITY_DN8873_c0_g1_i1.p2 TRINITY_DN8873_c0_g1~~TRINITY_DN8873_c0_g1_i1.p2  ORF type:complete len:642 (+),score=109.92 TRINITY_DN8873_c0_g1_i1:2440-4365(+)
MLGIYLLFVLLWLTAPGWGDVVGKQARGKPADLVDARRRQSIAKRARILERVLTNKFALERTLHRVVNSSVAGHAEVAQIRLQQLSHVEAVLDHGMRLLNRLTSTNLSEPEQVAVTSHHALEALHTAAVGFEELQRRTAKWREKYGSNSTQATPETAVEAVMSEISAAADQLEHRLASHTDNSFQREMNANGARLETVVVLDDTSSSAPSSNASTGDKAAGHVTTIVDPQDNHYVLQRPKDITYTYQDSSLINDIAATMGLAFLGGTVAHALNMPCFFGYIAVGVVLGPSGLDHLSNIVQVESMAQFGVFLILFCLGAEVSASKLFSICYVATCGGGFLVVFAVLCTMFIGALYSSPMSQNFLLGFCVSLSSTAVVYKCLDGPQDAGTRYSAALTGILVLQDVAVGGMIAVLPMLSIAGSKTEVVLALLRLFPAIGLAVFLARGISGCLLRPVLNYARRSSELHIMAAICLMCCTLTITEALNISRELGSFLAGLMISTHPDLLHDTMVLVEPVRDVFSTVFFASIGMHIFPSFLLSQASRLLALAVTVVLLKYASTLFVFVFFFKYDIPTASLISAGLSQISEFAFVLASYGRTRDIISREVYFMLLGTTALSFLTTPILWRASRWLLPPLSAVATTSGG